MSIEKELRLQVNFKNVYVIIKSNTVHSPVSIVFISPIWIAYTSRYINDNRRLKERSIWLFFYVKDTKKPTETIDTIETIRTLDS